MASSFLTRSVVLAIFLSAEALCGISVPAFPSAQGGGALSVGGRGGRVIEVTNLNASGPGSLRAAIEAKGARNVLFKVSGIIDLKGEPLRVKNPYLSIFGQSAPGAGITIRGHELSILTHDVIVQYIAIRTGRDDTFGEQVGDSIGLADNAYRVIIDHCSLSWSNDENAQVWSYANPAHDITWSWNIISEGLTYNHPSCGFIAGSNVDPDAMTNIDIHHNLFAHFNNRMPLVKVKSSRIVNNIIYDWSWFATAISDGVSADIIGNLYKPGPSTMKSRRFGIVVRSPELMSLTQALKQPIPGPEGVPSIFIEGNSVPGSTDPLQDNWHTVRAWDDQDWPMIDSVPYRRVHPLPANLFPIEINGAEQAEQRVLADAGANKHINAYGRFVNRRDGIDRRIVEEYRNGNGVIPYDENQVGGYEAIPLSTGYTDSDHDGLADLWESHYGLNPDDPSDAALDPDENGYSHLEEFLHGLKPVEP